MASRLSSAVGAHRTVSEPVGCETSCGMVRWSVSRTVALKVLPNGLPAPLQRAGPATAAPNARRPFASRQYAWSGRAYMAWA